MELMHRLGSNLTDEYAKSYAELIKKYPRSGDNDYIVKLTSIIPWSVATIFIK